MKIPSSEHHKVIEAAYSLLKKAVVSYQGRVVGTVAAGGDKLAADNYRECFVRDFIPSALVYLVDGELEPVRNFLELVLWLRSQEPSVNGHEIQPGVMPASFRVLADADGDERITADFGDRAIGRVAPVDSMMWWMILLRMYVKASGDVEFAERRDVQRVMHMILSVCLKDSFEVYPTLLVPDGSFMIDRRLGVYGHPLEIQALFYGALQTASDLLRPTPEHTDTVKRALKRQQALRTYLRLFYWLDLERLNEIHRYTTEEFGSGSVNMLNIFPDAIPNWVSEWLHADGGYFVGNLGPGRMDFRFFAFGNLLAVLFGIATEEQSRGLMTLYRERWSELMGVMPVKIVYPAAAGTAWELLTGSDSKNVPWSYHNAGNWPALLWAFVGAAALADHGELARRAYDAAAHKLAADRWPEYYDGKSGRLIGRHSNFEQTWSAASLIVAHKLLQEPSRLALFGSL